MKTPLRFAVFVAGLAIAASACTSGTTTAPSESAALSVAPSVALSESAAPSMASAPVEIEFWNYWDGNNGKAFTALADKFMQLHPNIKVKVVTIPWGDLLPKFQTAIAGKNLPAAGAGDIAWMAKLHASGALVDLTEAASKANVDLADFYPALLEYGKYQGKLESLPVSTNNLALFYNKDLFTKAGLDPNKPPTTWDELREAAKKITALGGGVQGFEIYTQPGEGLTWQFQPYLWQSGADYLTDDNTKAAFNTEAGKRALGFLVDLIQKDKVTQAGQWGAFDKGQAGMRIDGSWMVSGYASQAAFEFGTAMLPIPAGGEPATNMGGEQGFVFKTAPEKEAAAIEFLMWFTSTPVQAEWDSLTGFMPIRKSVLTEPTFTAWEATEPRFKAFIDQQQYAHARPPIEKYSETSDVFSKELEKAFYGKVSVADALANAEKAVNAVLLK